MHVHRYQNQYVKLQAGEPILHVPVLESCHAQHTYIYCLLFHAASHASKKKYKCMQKNCGSYIAAFDPGLSLVRIDDSQLSSMAW